MLVLLTITLRYVAIIILGILVGCSEKDDFKPIYDVPQEFQIYVDRFVSEAAARGLTVNISNLITRYDDALKVPHCASCNSISIDRSIQKVISMNPNMVCWVTDEEKEALFFHELGHCVLGRDHDDSTLPNGSPKSIMISGNRLLYESCRYPIDGTNACDHRYRRAYYIDELFDPSTPTPDWGM